MTLERLAERRRGGAWSRSGARAAPSRRPGYRTIRSATFSACASVRDAGAPSRPPRPRGLIRGPSPAATIAVAFAARGLKKAAGRPRGRPRLPPIVPDGASPAAESPLRHRAGRHHQAQDQPDDGPEQAASPVANDGHRDARGDDDPVAELVEEPPFVNGGGIGRRAAGEVGDTRFPGYLPDGLASMGCGIASSGLGPPPAWRRRLASRSR